MTIVTAGVNIMPLTTNEPDDRRNIGDGFPRRKSFHRLAWPQAMVTCSRKPYAKRIVFLKLKKFHINERLLD
jgi:hypothetical protein